MNCEKCGSLNVHEDFAQGECSCDDCGFVWELDTGIDEVEFEELIPGRKTRVGSIVNLNNSKASTIKRATQKISDVVLKIGLNNNIVDVSVNIYKRALNCKATYGVRTERTLGACIYIALRQLNKPVMLIDVCDKLEESVFAVGKMYKLLKRRLEIKVNDIDPSLYLERFAHELDLGQDRKERKKIIHTAFRIIQRLKKDWIVTGRKPSSITAAALLLSARLHRIDRDYEDFSRVCGISKTTIMNRISEFLETPTSKLTVEQLHTLDLEEECNPPSFSLTTKDFSSKSSISKADSIDFDNDYNSFDNELLKKESDEQLEMEFIELMKQIDKRKKTPSDIDFNELKKKGDNINSDLLIKLVLDECEEFLETDNEEFLGRIEQLKKCISGKPEYFINDDDDDDDYDDDVEIKDEQEIKEVDEIEKEFESKHISINQNNTSDRRLPNTLECNNNQMDFSCRLYCREENEQDYQMTEEEIVQSIENDLIPLDQSHAMLRWFFRQKNNRDYFKRRKVRIARKKELKKNQLNNELAIKRKKGILERKQKIIEDHNKAINELSHKINVNNEDAEVDYEGSDYEANTSQVSLKEEPSFFTSEMSPLDMLSDDPDYYDDMR